MANPQLASVIRKVLPKWNLNSLAEVFIFLLKRHRADYNKSLHLVARDRRAMYQQLCELPGLKVFPSQGNFILVKLPDGKDGAQLRDYLLSEHRIFVRECGNKLGASSQFVRLVVRPQEDVQRLLAGLSGFLYSTSLPRPFAGRELPAASVPPPQYGATNVAGAATGPGGTGAMSAVPTGAGSTVGAAGPGQTGPFPAAAAPQSDPSVTKVPFPELAPHELGGPLGAPDGSPYSRGDRGSAGTAGGTGDGPASARPDVSTAMPAVGQPPEQQQPAMGRVPFPELAPPELGGRLGASDDPSGPGSVFFGGGAGQGGGSSGGNAGASGAGVSDGLRLNAGPTAGQGQAGGAMPTAGGMTGTGPFPAVGTGGMSGTGPFPAVGTGGMSGTGPFPAVGPPVPNQDPLANLERLLGMSGTGVMPASGMPQGPATPGAAGAMGGPGGPGATPAAPATGRPMGASYPSSEFPVVGNAPEPTPSTQPYAHRVPFPELSPEELDGPPAGFGRGNDIVLPGEDEDDEDDSRGARGRAGRAGKGKPGKSGKSGKASSARSSGKTGKSGRSARGDREGGKPRRRRPSVPGTNEFPAIRVDDAPGQRPPLPRQANRSPASGPMPRVPTSGPPSGPMPRVPGQPSGPMPRIGDDVPAGVIHRVEPGTSGGPMMIPPGPAGPPSGPFPVVDPGPPSGQFPVVQPGPPTGQFPVPELAPRQLAGPPSGFGDPVGMGPDERLGLRGGDGGGRTGQGDAAGKKKKKRRRPSVPGTNEFPAIRLPDEPGMGDYDMYR